MRVLILGVTGMLGNAVLRVLVDDPALDVRGTARSRAALAYFQPSVAERIVRKSPCPVLTVKPEGHQFVMP